MLRQDFNRIDPKRRIVVDHRKKQFATPQYKDLDYPHLLAELEACSFRNKTPAETATHMKPLLKKFMNLEANSSGSSNIFAQRQKDHYSHFILRLAFSSTEDLRRRFSRVESTLFRLRLNDDDLAERSAFVKTLGLDWCEDVTEADRREYAAELAAFAGRKGDSEDDAWFKVDWERVPELIESRRVFLKAGKAFVPGREQTGMVIGEFTSRLERQLELTARALPRLDEDDRLTPILNHLSKNFITPDSSYMSSTAAVPGAQISAANVDSLSQHFPACMSHLHRSLRRDAHLKHYGRLQYSLFLKGIGLNLEECLMFWRSSFNKITDDTFNKEYRYNVRHVYGDVGGDSNRRGGGYSPFSCQKILTEHPPGPGEAHGCPYRHFNMENLTALVQSMGVSDRSVLQGIKEDKDKQKFHMACNRVFEHVHKSEIRKAKDEGVMTQNQLETIVHPNEYFKRSFLLKNLGKETDASMAS
ncbi:hypothetical protein FZEAL_1125 [Fusarium zealandicum]|uniref:DNA primase large subunit n=1 Tax=Fusarium zealandicum TaxID=1053134 RepID=A0A8H4UTP1_9HYPO|nr:hypothetical protein FZEAL_1125 [Fusarium zealandicum]